MNDMNIDKRCAGCGQPIGDESYHWHLGDLYHDRCEMSTGMICTDCGESIRCGEAYYSRLGRVYHGYMWQNQNNCRRDGDKKYVIRCKCKAIEELAIRLDNHEEEERMADDSDVEPIGLFDRALRERLAKNETDCDRETVDGLKKDKPGMNFRVDYERVISLDNKCEGRYRVRPIKEPDCYLEDDRGNELTAELQKIIRLHDGHKFSVLAEQYNAFDDAIDSVGDYYVTRLNVADLLDEILCKYCGDWVRSRCD